MQIRGGNLERNDTNEKSKKITRLILIFIVLIFIAIIAIMCTIIYIQKNTFKVYVDGALVNMPEDTIIIDEETKKAYVDIKGIAKYLGYDAHNGEYKVYSEDTNKCWVESKEETASFFLNSNKISKIPPDQSLDYEDYTIEDPVVSKNGKLYCSSEGIKVGFNVIFNYTESENKVEIYTLPNLVKQYTTTFKNYGYTDGLSTNFNNQKAILYNMFVVKKDNNLYGVVNSNNEEIISSKYKSMEFNESAKEFYVTNSSNKVGIVTVSRSYKNKLII